MLLNFVLRSKLFQNMRISVCKARKPTLDAHP
jgi:hypothetical protein